MTVLALAVLGTVGTFAYSVMFGGYVFPSLPPIVKWRYDWKPAPNSDEARLYSDFLIGKDWLDGG